MTRIDDEARRAGIIAAKARMRSLSSIPESGGRVRAHVDVWVWLISHSCRAEPYYRLDHSLVRPAGHTMRHTQVRSLPVLLPSYSLTSPDHILHPPRRIPPKPSPFRPHIPNSLLEGIKLVRPIIGDIVPSQCPVAGGAIG